MINRLTIFGVGLIGGSLALALRQANYCRTVVGCSRSKANLLRALELEIIDEWTLDPVEAVKDADMILLAVPVGVMESVMNKIAGHIGQDAVLTDAGSSKASVVAAAESAFGTIPANFVPGHPIAGREKSGVDAAVADLFVAHKVILCPLEHNRPETVAKVSAMWEAAGAQVETLGIKQHDQVLAATSHLPHVLAYSLVNTLANTEFVDEIFQFAAGGFRDLSRIASSDPVMWRDICLENREAILTELDRYQTNLDGLRNLIEQSSGDQLFDAFQHAKSVRDANLIKQESRLE